MDKEIKILPHYNNKTFIEEIHKLFIFFKKIVTILRVFF